MENNKRILKLAYIGWANSIHLQRFLRWFTERGHEVYLFTDKNKDIPGVHNIVLRSPRNYFQLIRFRWMREMLRFLIFISSVFMLRRHLRIIKPDVLHLHTLYMPAQLGVFSGFSPLVVMPWNGDILWQNDPSLFHQLLVRYALRSAAIIPLQTEYLKQRCMELGAEGDRVRIVQFGVDLNKFQSKSDLEKIKKDLKLDTDNIVISTRSIHYNIITIVEAIPIVLKSIPDAKFIFIWPDTQERSNPVIRKIEELGVSGSVRIVGSVAHEEMPKYLSIAKTFISISEIDCFPQTALEAMAMKVFPVMGDIAPIRTYIKSKNDGFLVEPLNVHSVAQGIIDSLNLEEKKRKEITENNYNLVSEKADFNHEMGKMEEIYYQLLEEAKK